MTTIAGAGVSANAYLSGVKNSPAPTPPFVDRAKVGKPMAGTVTPATTTESRVSLGGSVAVDPTYRNPFETRRNLAWASAPNDALSQLMFRNISAQVQSPSRQERLLAGLGTQALNQLATTASDFQQTVVDYQALNWNPVGDPESESFRSTPVSRTTDIEALALAKNSTNSIRLTLQTTSGKSLGIALSFGRVGNEITSSLSVEGTVNGALDEAEQAAVAALSSGFEKVLRAIGENASSIDVSGLVDYDASLISGVDLSVSRGVQLGVDLKTLEFHADAKGRSLTVQRRSGAFSVSVDFSRSALLGTAEQQKAAVSRYLDQFEEDARRGHGDRTRLQEFKAAFSQLNAHVPGTPAASGSLGRDRSLLSGLADFKATLNNDFAHSGAGGVTVEAGHMDYQVTQDTTVTGKDKFSGLSVTQVQSTRLKSVFVRSFGGEMLDTSKGNYELLTIDDEMSVKTTFSYAKNELQNASRQRLIKQLEQLEKYVDHQLVSSRETPATQSTFEDYADWLMSA